MVALGYTKLTWDNDSGFEQKPWSFIKLWSSLTKNEKDAAKVLGFTKKSWEKKRKSRIFQKKWDDMTSCSDGEDPPRTEPQRHCSPNSNSAMFLFSMCQDVNASLVCADSIKPGPSPIAEPPPLGPRVNAAKDEFEYFSRTKVFTPSLK